MIISVNGRVPFQAGATTGAATVLTNCPPRHRVWDAASLPVVVRGRTYQMTRRRSPGWQGGLLFYFIRRVAASRATRRSGIFCASCLWTREIPVFGYPNGFAGTNTKCVMSRDKNGTISLRLSSYCLTGQKYGRNFFLTISAKNFRFFSFINFDRFSVRFVVSISSWGSIRCVDWPTQPAHAK